MPVAMSRTAPVQTLLEGAELDVNASIDDFACQFRFLERRKPVPQPVRSRVPQRVSNGFGPAVLARVNLDTESRIAPRSEVSIEPRSPRPRAPALHRR